MRITTIENIQAIFNILHDGGISSFELNDGDITLDVEIQYLAERVKPDFNILKLTLFGTRVIECEPWYDDPDKHGPPVTEIENIFTPELGILSADVEDHVLKVSCSQSKAGYGYCGGLLKLYAEGAAVTDENGLFYSLTQLQELCSGYWTQWSEKNA